MFQSIEAFLTHLKKLDVDLRIVDGNLHCDAPVGALTPDLQTMLTDRKSEIISYLDTAEVTVQGHLQKVASLSFAQRRLWFLQQMEPQSCTYNMLEAWLLKGDLDIHALHRSLCTIIQRHETLRTTFPQIDDTPYQMISEAFTADLPVTDLAEYPSAQLDMEIRRIAEEEAGRPFDLEKGPLLRCSMVRLHAHEHVLMIVMHHIISDGWSMGLFSRDLGAVYTAFSKGLPFPLPALPIQYAEFAERQRRRLQGDVLKKQLTYWKQQLAGAPPLLELPTDHPRPAVQRFHGSRHTVVLPMQLLESLRRFSINEGATLFMTLLAAFQLLLHRYSGQPDISVGVPIAGRTRSDIENLIGFFVNTLVLRTDLSGNPTLKELLGRVREVTLDGYDHQDFPFEKLVEELQPHRDLSYSPLFQVMFVMQNMPKEPFQLTDLTASPLDIDRGNAKFDLTLYANETESGMKVLLEYNTDLFDPGTIERMAGHYQTLLSGIVFDPDRRIGNLPILTDAERRQLLVSWNDTGRAFPRNKCIHHLFEEQVSRTPDNAAVVFDDQMLTYRELNRRANQVAHHLIRQGVGPEVLVGVCMERSMEMVVGLLGILKAGGAYVPLDPAYPAERLSLMVDDARIRLIMSQSHLRSRIPECHGRFISMDGNETVFSAEGDDNPASPCKPENLAYVIFTSGSTGKPKGVAVEHSSVAAFIAWSGETYSSKQLSGVLASSSICFDISVFELFSTLCLGGKVVLVKNLLDLPEMRHADQVTLINTVPSACEGMLQLSGIPKSVGTVNLAGEPLHGNLVQAIYSNDSVEHVFNLYGPTEDTVYSTVFRAEKQGGTSPPIGKPIANSRAYVLDSYGQPVPLGVPGELYLGGAGLARGYLNRPGLTEEKFIPDPFSDEEGARLYRTGDLVQYRPDGNLVFLRRMDHQVKLRGFRIELGEVEAVLETHPGIRSALAVVLEDTPGDKRLVAYTVPSGKNAPDDEELQDYLRQKLPDYMVPAAFIMIAAIPMMPNGKVNRAALPVPGLVVPSDAYIAPRTPVENAVAEIYRSVLKLDRIGIHDNFFDLGGHSLLATKVIAKIRDQFDIDLPLRSIFEATTVAGLSIAITLKRIGSTASEDQFTVLDELDDMSDEKALNLLKAELEDSYAE